jgi:transcriptional regulator with XRE-family HTH domain
MSTRPPLSEDPALSTPLREARIAAGLTQVEFGERTGYAQSLVSRLEGGQLTPWRRFRARASEVLGVPETDLFEDAR